MFVKSIKLLFGLLLVLICIITACAQPTGSPSIRTSDLTITTTATLEVFSPPQYGQVNMSEAIIRQANDIDSLVIVQLPAGTLLTIVARQEDWFKVEAAEIPSGSGWVLAEFLTITPFPATPTPEPVATPLPSSTKEGVIYSAPKLISPPDGEVFVADRRQIEFSWRPVGSLAEDEYYQITVLFAPLSNETAIWQDFVWSKTTSATAHPYLLELMHPNRRELEWYVTVIKQTGKDENSNPTGPIISQESEHRTFTWKMLIPSSRPTSTPYVPTPATP